MKISIYFDKGSFRYLLSMCVVCCVCEVVSFDYRAIVQILLLLQLCGCVKC